MALNNMANIWFQKILFKRLCILQTMLAQSYTTIDLNTFWRVKKVKTVTNYSSPIVAFIEYMKASIIISIKENIHI
jgi:hypothetical protein